MCLLPSCHRVALPRALPGSLLWGLLADGRPIRLPPPAASPPSWLGRTRNAVLLPLCLSPCPAVPRIQGPLAALGPGPTCP